MSALNLYLDLRAEGNQQVKGECEVQDFVGCIELDDWSWSLDMEQQQGQSNAIPTLFEFSKAPCVASTAMMSALVSGKPYPTAKISLLDATDTHLQVVVQLEQVRVMEYQLSGRDGNAAATLDETWTFDYSKISFEYSMPGKQGVWQVDVDRPPGSEAKKADKIAGDTDNTPAGQARANEEMAAEMKMMREQIARLLAVKK